MTDLTGMQQLATIAACVLGTMLTRFLPFALFPAGKKTPAAIRYLGNVLPGAVFSLLLAYCLKDVRFLEQPHGAPELLAILACALLHLRFRQMILSIFGGTALYMLLVQFVFIIHSP